MSLALFQVVECVLSIAGNHRDGIMTVLESDCQCSVEVCAYRVSTRFENLLLLHGYEINIRAILLQSWHDRCLFRMFNIF